MGFGATGGYTTSSIGYNPKKSYKPRGGLGNVRGEQPVGGKGRTVGNRAYAGPAPGSSRGGAGRPGGGRGGGGGGAASGYDARVDPNPYLDKIFNRYEGLFDQSQELYGKAPDATPALENYKDLRAQGMKEATAMAGSRGFAPGTGMSLAQTQDLLSRSQQGEQELTANWANRALDFQKDLLGTMGGVLGGAAGVGAGIGQEQLGWGRQGLDSQRHLLDSWYKTQMLPIEMEKAKTANLSNQIAAIGSLAGLF